MREILFRGKLLDGTWSEGNLEIKTNGVYIITPDETVIGRYGRVIPETVGQYTGLTDKNGNKIFEGDVVEYDHERVTTFWEEVPETYKPRRSHSCHWENDVFHYKRNYVVEWKEKDARWILRNGSDQHDLRLMPMRMHNGVVIGNIHDNPELLKGGEPDAR